MLSFFGRADIQDISGFDTRKELMLDVTQDAPSKLGMEYQWISVSVDFSKKLAESEEFSYYVCCKPFPDDNANICLSSHHPSRHSSM